MIYHDPDSAFIIGIMVNIGLIMYSMISGIDISNGILYVYVIHNMYI